MTAPIQIGVQLTPQHASYGQLRDAAARAEEAGVDAIFNWDHFQPLGGDPGGAHFECWTTLAAWAEQTERVQIGPLVSAIGYRNPDLLADMARTVDHISGGRMILGVGAGFKEREYLSYGYDFPSVRERLDALEQGLGRISSRLGQLNPPPLRRIPILVAGGGERRSLRIVAEHADIWNTFAEGQDFERKSSVLDDHCRAVGRDPAAIRRSVLVAGDPRDVGEPLRLMGVTLLIVLVHAPYDLETVSRWVGWRDQVNAAAR
jgi:probable F420-dependent oxidoreductase